MNLEQLYKIAGGNYGEIVQRIPSTALLEKLVRMFVKDSSKAELDTAVSNADPKEAFRAVHTLKGVTLSLGFTSLAETTKALTEDLRPGTFGGGWQNNYNSLCLEYDKVISAIKEFES